MMFISVTSSHPKVFCWKGVLKTCSKFTGKHPLWSAISKQLYWNRTSAWLYSCKLSAYIQSTFFQEHLWMASSEVSGLLQISKILNARRSIAVWNSCRAIVFVHIYYYFSQTCKIDNHLNLLKRFNRIICEALTHTLSRLLPTLTTYRCMLRIVRLIGSIFSFLKNAIFISLLQMNVPYWLKLANAKRLKMIRQTLEILYHLLLDF